MNVGVVVPQQVVVGGNVVAREVMPRAAQRLAEFVPQLRENLGGTEVVVPVQLLLTQGKDAAQHEFGHPIGMGFGVSQGQAGPPRSAEDLPALNAKQLPDLLKILDEVPRRIGGHLTWGAGLGNVRGRQTATPLI